MIKELEIHLNTYDTITVDWENVIESLVNSQGR